MKKFIVFAILFSLMIASVSAKVLEPINKNYRAQGSIDLQMPDIKKIVGINISMSTTLLFIGDLDWKKLITYIQDRYKNEDKVNTYIYGCSNGSEAYTMSILLQENFQNPEKFYPIIAKDIDKSMIDTVNSMKNDIMPFSLMIQDGWKIPFDKRVKKAINISDLDSNKYYTKKDRFIIISDETRKPVIFQYADIIKDLNSIDSKNPSIVMARNMWQYIDIDTYQEYADKLYKKLAPKSIMILGGIDFFINETFWNIKYPIISDSLIKAGFTPSKIQVGTNETSKNLIFEKN